MMQSTCPGKGIRPLARSLRTKAASCTTQGIDVFLHCEHPQGSHCLHACMQHMFIHICKQRSEA